MTAPILWKHPKAANITPTHRPSDLEVAKIEYDLGLPPVEKGGE